MAVGKSKKMGKKGNKKKPVEYNNKKEWYDVKMPALFTVRNIGKTPVNKTVGTKLAADGLRGRVYEVSLGDLNNSESDFRKFRFMCEEVKGKDCLTNFHGMSFTRDKLCSIVKKWHTMIEANTLVKTTDGYLLRVFCVGVTRRQPNQVSKTTYAQASKKRALRALITKEIQKEVTTCALKDVVAKLIPDSIGKDIQKLCERIFPLQDVYIRKVKVIKKPRFEMSRLIDAHEGVTAGPVDDSAPLDRPAQGPGYEPPVQATV